MKLLDKILWKQRPIFIFKFFFCALLALIFLPLNVHAQFDGNPFLQEMDEDLQIGGDIFNDFTEEADDAKVLEAERFYKYGRFFQVNLGLGLTDFLGNRGSAFQQNPPSYHFSLTYFFSFQSALVLGVEYSEHTAFIDTLVNSYRTPNNPLGAVRTTMLRPFLGFRYYIDTSDLGTALTYSNPYLIGRFEYWYQTNKFSESPEIEEQTGGGLGAGLGAGLEFPIRLKEYYVGVEFLYHRVNFFDRFTQDYRQITPEDDPVLAPQSDYGFEDLIGDVYSIMITLNITW